MPSQHFTDFLKKMGEVHRKKSHDYAQDSDPFSNFSRAAEIASWFKNPIDQVFVGIIGIKLARLAELLNGKEPKNESLDDNMLDLANYCGLWAAMKLRDREVGEKNRDFDKVTEINRLMTNSIPQVPRQTAVSLDFFTLPVICLECQEQQSWHGGILHAIREHSAIWDYKQRTLKYPMHGLYIFPPNLDIGAFAFNPTAS